MSFPNRSRIHWKYRTPLGENVDELQGTNTLWSIKLEKRANSDQFSWSHESLCPASIPWSSELFYASYKSARKEHTKQSCFLVSISTAWWFPYESCTFRNFPHAYHLILSNNKYFYLSALWKLILCTFHCAITEHTKTILVVYFNNYF